MFACIGDREGKNRDFGGEMVNLEKVKYGCKAEDDCWKASECWSFEHCLC